MKNYQKTNRTSINQKAVRMKRLIALLVGILVAFTTTYTLILPAITVDVDTADEMSGLVLEDSADNSMETPAAEAAVPADENPYAEESAAEVDADPAAELTSVPDISSEIPETIVADPAEVSTENTSSDGAVIPSENGTYKDEETNTAEETLGSQSMEEVTAGEDSEEVPVSEESVNEGESSENGNTVEEISEENAAADPESKEETSGEEDPEESTSEGATSEEETSEDKTSEEETSEEETSEEETSEEETSEEETSEEDQPVTSPLTYHCDYYDIEVSFDSSVQLPAGTKLEVRELYEESLPYYENLEYEDLLIYQHYFELSKEEMKKLRVEEFSTAVLYELSFVNEEGDEVLLPYIDYDIHVKYQNVTVPHKEEVIRTALYTYDTSLNEYRADLIEKNPNPEQTMVVTTDEQDLIHEIDLEKVSFYTYDTVLGLFAGKETEEEEMLFEAELENVSVHVTAPAGAFPEGTTMEVKPVEEQAVLDAVQSAVESEVKSVTAVDITFYDADGCEIQPEKEIQVSIKTDVLQEPEEPVLVHVDHEGEANVVEDVTHEEEGLSFESKDFSVYALVYTVDFEYEVDGKTYSFSIPGGGFVSLNHLVEVLGIAADAVVDASEVTSSEEGAVYDSAIELNNTEVSETAAKFAAEIAAVAFSNPELVWVGKVETDITVGALKEACALNVQYSTELTAEQINEINAQILAAGDWVLISLQPFNSEEVLTVSMNNGNQFEVKVTDAQVTDGVTDGGKYLIYYNSVSNGIQTYYVLKNDGTVYTTTDSADLDTLGDDYLWTFDYFERFGIPYALIHNESTYITLDGSSSGIFSNLPIPTYFTPINDSYGGYKLYGLEWVSTSLITGYYQNHYMTFDGNNFVRSDNENGNTRMKLWEQGTRQYHFTVKTEYNNIFRGTVSGKNENGTQQDNVASFVGITNNNKKNQYSITATPGEGYRFKEWRLGDTVIPGGTTLAAGDLTFPDDNMVLTAVFEKDPEKPDVGVDDYSQMIENWKNQNMNQPVNLDKTAQVYDYDNRIYEIGLDVSAKAKDIEKDVEMAFVTDISRSMYTPAELIEVGTYTSRDDLINQLNSLKNNRVAENQSGDGDDVYYLMADEDTSALVFAVRKIGTSNTYKYWKWIDCSYDNYTYDDKIIPAGINTNSDDKSWRDGNNGGGYLYVRASDVNGKVMFINNTFTLNGKIYVAKDVRYRLDYLQQAVDIVSDVLYTVNPGAKIGLVTFDATAHGPFGLYGKEQYGDLITAINSVSPQGNTNQAAGLNLASGFWNTASDENHQRAVMLITDGAPNGGKNNPVTWADIQTAASNLYNQKGAIVHTVGLSVSNVLNAPEGLAATALAGGGGRTMMPNSGTELVSSVLDIIATYLKDCNYKGTLHDDIDPSFYPVNQDGSPITPGYYSVDGILLDQQTVQEYNEAGTEYYLWKYNNDSSWSITWYNLEFGRGTTESPATHKSIYLKAREDFMGGNTIATNIDSAHAIASKAVFKNEQGQTTKERFLEVIKDGMADTPYVNVDELHLTQHETEWTVYLGTEVTPEDQLEALWNNIKVKQVVKEGGTIPADETNPADVTRISGKEQMWYEHINSVNASDSAAPENSETCGKLPLSHYGLSSYYDTLLQAIINNNSYDSGDIAYNAYGHNGVGYFRITAVKNIVDGAVDAAGKAPNQHTTDKAASPAEAYTITVTYTPVTTGSSETYENTTTNGTAGKVTSGIGVDEVKSENKHKINVIKKGLEIEKVDESNNKITNYNATFNLYRPATANEIGTTVSGLPEGSYYLAAEMTTNEGTAALSDELSELRKLADGQHYYLVEMQEPEGYEKLSGPIQIDITVTSGQETKPYETTEKITDLINVGTPSVNISFSGKGVAEGTHKDNRFVLVITNIAKTVDIIIHKVDNNNVPLSGATFKLMKGSAIVPVVSEGTGVVVEPKVTSETVTIKDNTFTIPEGGVSIKNLTVSEEQYSIVEVSPPAGYIITNDTPATFKIIAGNISEEGHITGVTYEPDTNDFTVPNEPGVALPSTGGSGPWPFFLFGGILAAASGILLLKRYLI